MTASIDLFRAQAIWISPQQVVLPPALMSLADAQWRLTSAPHCDLRVISGQLMGSRVAERELIPSHLHPDAVALYPHLASYFALDVRDAPPVNKWLRRQLAVSATSEGQLRYASSVQIAPVIDAVMSPSARYRTFGPSFEDDRIRLAVWAPTAQRLEVQLWPDQESDAPTVLPMSSEPDGTWTVDLPLSFTDASYVFAIWTPRPGEVGVEHSLVTDPYSTGLTLNSQRSVLTNLDDPRWSPPGFATSTGPQLTQLVDATVYELHVRDFSMSDPRIHPAHRGSYLAFADDGLGTRHLRSLANAGLNTVHLLPVFDVASINEDRAMQRSVAGLAEEPPDSSDQQSRIDAIARADAFNWGYDPFHWLVPEGSYTSNTAAAHGGQRSWEFRRMVQALHALGLRVVLDQVFTHTAAAGRAPQSVLDKIVPGYYHRLDSEGTIYHSTACNNVATENVMAEKIMVDAVVRWVTKYRVDGFRFDLMGHSSAANMMAVRTALNELTIAKDGIDGRHVYLYGEGWNFGEVANNARFIQATQGQVHEAKIATFTDRLRDAVRGGRPFDADPRTLGFGSGLADHPGPELARATDIFQLGLAGNLRDFQLHSAFGPALMGSEVDYFGSPAGYAIEPWDVISYVDAHDNETLWDALTFKQPDISMAERVRLNTFCLACCTLAQTPVLWHAGSDLLRSKSLDRNSYDSGDWFNRLDWSGRDNAFGHGLPHAAENANRWNLARPLLANPDLKPTRDVVRQAAACAADILRLRFSSRLFRLGSADLIHQKLSFPVSGTLDQVAGVVAMFIDDRHGPRVDAERSGLLVIFNATSQVAQQHVPALVGCELHLSRVQQHGADPVVRLASWDSDAAVASVPGRTVAVFEMRT